MSRMLFQLITIINKGQRGVETVTDTFQKSVKSCRAYNGHGLFDNKDKYIPKAGI